VKYLSYLTLSIFSRTEFSSRTLGNSFHPLHFTHCFFGYQYQIRPPPAATVLHATTTDCRLAQLSAPAVSHAQDWYRKVSLHIRVTVTGETGRFRSVPGFAVSRSSTRGGKTFYSAGISIHTTANTKATQITQISKTMCDLKTVDLKFWQRVTQ
jgi:hypothetical protein